MTLSDYQLMVLRAEICPYCKSGTKIVSETEIYGKEYKGRKMFCCINFPNCDSYVGTHDDGSPLGRLARKELRLRKKYAHDSFDKIWMEKFVDRSDLYDDLAEFLQLPIEYTHIGMFNETTCLKTEVWAKQYYKNLTQK